MEACPPIDSCPQKSNEEQIKKPRKKPWIASEELLLIEEVLTNEELLFGDLRAPTSGKPIGRRRAEAWAEIAHKVTSQCVQTKRDPEEVKKKYFNLKQRAKEKIDSQRKARKQTGGGPAPPTLSASEEALLNSMGDRPGIKGLTCGVDTDAPETNESTNESTNHAVADNSTEDASKKVTASTQSHATEKRKSDSEVCTESSGRKNRRKSEQESETLINTKLDSERIILEKEKTTLEIAKLKAEISCLKMKESTFKSVKDTAETINLYYQQKLGMDIFGDQMVIGKEREV